jgi:hypothetical protein
VAETHLARVVARCERAPKGNERRQHAVHDHAIAAFRQRDMVKSCGTEI